MQYGYYVDYSKLNISEINTEENEIFLAETERPEISNFRNYLHGQRISESTVNTYTNFVIKFLTLS